MIKNKKLIILSLENIIYFQWIVIYCTIMWHLMRKLICLGAKVYGLSFDAAGQASDSTRTETSHPCPWDMEVNTCVNAQKRLFNYS